jgi:hypothetical protein
MGHCPAAAAIGSEPIAVNRMNLSSTDFVCHLAVSGARRDLCVAEPVAPAWATAAGISWRAPDGTVTASRDGAVIRLVLREVTGDARTVEWNPTAARATLLRNGLWSKPFYYFAAGQELVVSDSLRRLVLALPREPQLDRRALDAYLAVEFFPAPLTPFLEIRKVGVEEILEVDLRSGKAETTTSRMPERNTTDFQDAVESLRSALSDALERRLGDGPGERVLFCSGGLDSTILAQLMGGRGRSMVLSYPGSWKDEVDRARRTTRFTRLPLQEVQLPGFSAESFGGYVSLLDEPVGDTSFFAARCLCARLPRGTWIVGGHGSGALSLMNVNHKHLRDALASGPREQIVERFSRLVSCLDAESRRLLLGWRETPGSADPVEEMVQRELGGASDYLAALCAIIRREFCVAREMTQIWPVCGAFGHTPVMPFFEPGVRAIFDQLPENVLRTEHYERRLLGELAARLCPWYVPQPRQLGSGLPLGVRGYPDPVNMEEVVEAFSLGPVGHEELRRLLKAAAETEGGERFERLRRLWSALVLNAWLQQLLKAHS